MCMSLIDFYCVEVVFFLIIVFFFKQKTAYEMRISDWSSDVCSSDLTGTPHLSRTSTAASYQSGFSRKMAQRLSGLEGGVVAQPVNTISRVSRDRKSVV